METLSIKKRAHDLVDALPENASWKDLLYEIYVLQEIQAGLEDSYAGKIESVESIRAEFGLVS